MRDDELQYMRFLMWSGKLKIPPPPFLHFEGRLYAAVRRLFKKHDLDPHTISDWHLLLFKLADKRGGKPRARSDMVRLCQLRCLVECLHRSNPGKSDEWCCEQISKNVLPLDEKPMRLSENPFKGKKTGTLRRWLVEARKSAMREIYENYREACIHHVK